MSFLSNIFQKKPGGTAVGNLLRAASSQIPYIGSALGTGANRIEVGQTKTNIQLAREAGLNPVDPAQQVANLAGQAYAQTPSGQQVIASTLLSQVKKYWWVLLIPGGLILYIFLKPKRRR